MRLRLLPLVLAVLGLTVVPGRAQSPVVPHLAAEPLGALDPVDTVQAPAARSGAAAFGLSLLVPGLGHRYANGSWGAGSSAHALADAALWVGLIDAGVRLNRSESTYETLAALRADAQIEGQSRGFFLTLARYRSSEDYIDALLRERRWNELEDAQRPENQFAWASEEDYQGYRTLREDAESLRRRRPVYAALLASNRVLAGVGALRATRKVNRAQATLALGLPPDGSDLPSVNLSVRF